MNTSFANPVKKNNFEASELKIRKQKAHKSERQGSKKMINRMILEDAEIENEIINSFEARCYDPLCPCDKGIYELIKN